MAILYLKIHAGTKGAVISRGAHIPKAYTTTKDLLCEGKHLKFSPLGLKHGWYESGSIAYELSKEGLCAIVKPGDDQANPRHVLIVAWKDVETSLSPLQEK